VSLPTSVTCSRASASSAAATRSASPCGVRSAASGIGSVRAERQIERDAAEVGREPRRDLAPQVGVHEQPMQEDDRRPAAGLEVAQPDLGQLELARDAERRVAPGRPLVHRRHRCFLLPRLAVFAVRAPVARLPLSLPRTRSLRALPSAGLRAGWTSAPVGRRAGRSGGCGGSLAGTVAGCAARPARSPSPSAPAAGGGAGR
jgi:hypothetical protein